MPMPSRTLLACCLPASVRAATPALAQGTAFTYQGRLSVGGAPGKGSYEMRFTLYDSLEGGGAVSPEVVLTVAVSEGLFVVEALDFGACGGCFDGSPRFLEVAVRPAGSPDPFTVLDPRQAIEAVPYAMRSTSAAAADTAANAT